MPLRQRARQTLGIEPSSFQLFIEFQEEGSQTKNPGFALQTSWPPRDDRETSSGFPEIQSRRMCIWGEQLVACFSDDCAFVFVCPLSVSI